MNFENFNDQEALRIAINMEKEGLVFYSTMAENTKDARAKEIFAKLAEEEKEHMDTFQRIYDSLPSSQDQMVSCEDYTAEEYLKHLVDTGVFTQKNKAKELALQIKNDVDALKIGIQAEKEAILYYREALQHTKNNDGRKAFEQLIHEEKKHLNLLAKQIALLKESAS
ncbi:MAG: ferritin family protein [Candidatus Kuenenia sp.]|nr:ferritin family protein [Candidatus Kuenenia hertensis]